MPEEPFRVGRKAILETFLNRPRIFSTDAMFDLLELPARANLARAITRAEKA